MNLQRFGLGSALLCALVWFAPACIQQKKPDHSDADKLPFGQVLEPREDVPVTGPFAIRGWALSENGIRQVAIYIDREFYAEAKLGERSPEAQKAHPEFPGSATAGWRFDAEPGMFTAATHELTVQARSTTGAVRDLGTMRLVIGTPFGKMDEPVNGKVIDGPFEIRGWAASEHGLDQVMIFVDGKFLANPRLGLERKDVHKTFPNARDSLLSGWRYDATPAMFPPGEHEIVVKARSKAGAEHELGRAKVTIRR